MASKWTFTAVFFLALCVNASSVASDWYVKTDGSNRNDGQTWESAKSTIQSAIDAAISGDVIHVAQGTYRGKLRFEDGIALLGAGAETTRIEYGSNDVVIVARQIDRGRISGFTIAYTGTSGHPVIYLEDSSLTIARNVITGATYHGIEIMDNSDPQIIDNEVRGNAQFGILAYAGGRGTISGNVVSDNGYDGIAVVGNSDPQISHNIIIDNYYSGIWVAAGASPSIFNNIIIKNKEFGIDVNGYNYGGSGRPTVLFNDVWGNGATNYNSIDKPATDISAGPRFVDLANGDYHLRPDSPCRGSADDGSDLGMYSLQRPTIQSPSVNITSEHEYWENDSLTVEATAKDIDGSITDVLFQYSLDGNTWHDISRDESPPYSVDLNTELITPADDQGVLVKAVATNSDGLTWKDIVEFRTPPKAPGFQGTNLVDDKTVSMEDLKGYVLIIDFWATWCGPCKAEIPGFVELQDKYGDRGFSVIGMSLDRAPNAKVLVKNFIVEYNINYPVLMAVGKIERDYEQAWGQPINSIPTTFIVDRSGSIVSVYVGARPKSVFEQDILELLEEPPDVEDIAITSLPITTGAEGMAYTYDVQTGYEEFIAMTYSLTTAPDGMTIDPTTGLITWTPSSTQAGAHSVVAQVDADELDASDIQSFTIDVAEAVNNPPVITSTPATTGTEGFSYQYQVDATDADSDPLTFSLITSPEGMIIDADTGLIDWTPTTTQAGDSDVTVQVTDGRDGSDAQSFTISIANVNDPPVITSTPVAAGTEGVLYSYDVDAADPDADDTLTYSLTVSPEGVTIDPTTGLIQWTPGYDVVDTEEGSRSVDVTIRVTDTQESSDEQNISITITNVNRPPEARSLAIGPGSPSTGSNLTASYVYADPDGDAESGSEIRWYKDGELQESYSDQKTVHSAATTGGQQWHFTVKPKDGVDFGDLQTSDATTIIDTSRPVITSGPSVSDITSTSAVVVWSTDEAGSSVVEYGTEVNYGLTAESEDNVTEHSVSLDALLVSATYYYRVGSTDASGNTVWSGQQIFMSGGMKGDVDDDGRVSSRDALLTLRLAAGLMEPTEYQEWAADMNEDGRIRSNDAMLILLAAAGQ